MAVTTQGRISVAQLGKAEQTRDTNVSDVSAICRALQLPRLCITILAIEIYICNKY
jgi:hypothetical protein